MPTDAEAEGQTTGPATWLPLVMVCLAMGAEAYDASSIPVAISVIVKDLATDLSTIQAALVLFSVICAPLMLTAGTLGDIHGKRRALRLGISLFGAGTLVAALAPHATVFILGFSILNALGAVLVVPTGAALLIASYQGYRRGPGRRPCRESRMADERRGAPASRGRARGCRAHLDPGG